MICGKSWDFCTEVATRQVLQAIGKFQDMYPVFLSWPGAQNWSKLPVWKCQHRLGSYSSNTSSCSKKLRSWWKWAIGAFLMPFPSVSWLMTDPLKGTMQHRCKHPSESNLGHFQSSVLQGFGLDVFFSGFCLFYIPTHWGWSLIWRILVKNLRSNKQIQNHSPK